MRQPLKHGNAFWATYNCSELNEENLCISAEIELGQILGLQVPGSSSWQHCSCLLYLFKDVKIDVLIRHNQGLSWVFFRTVVWNHQFFCPQPCLLSNSHICTWLLGKDSWQSLGLQGDPTSPSWRRSVLGVHWKDWCWSWNSSTLATSCEELTHWKGPDAGRDWGQEEKGKTEDEMAGWHHWLDGHEFGWTLGVDDGQGGLACCD